MTDYAFIFVYGTLKSYQRNHALMLARDAVLIRPIMTRFAAYDLCEFDSTSAPGRVTPSVLENGTYYLGGELYRIKREHLGWFDDFEKVGVHYARRSVELEGGQMAEMYLHLPASPKRPREESLFIRRWSQSVIWDEKLTAG